MLSKIDCLLEQLSQDELQKHNRRRLERASPMPQSTKGEVNYVKEAGEAVKQDWRPPMMAGTLTNWKYTPMFTIEEFVMMMDKNYKSPLENLIENGQLS